MDIRQQAVTEDLQKKIEEGLRRHAIQMTGHDEKGDAVALVAMEGDALAGAIVVQCFWNGLHVKYFYVEEAYRGQGLGARLIQRAFAYGLEKKCPFAFAATMSFQALEFYQKMGFKLDFTRSGYAHGTSFHYLSRPLDKSDCTIRPLREQDIEILGELYFPWSTKEETIAKWTRYLEEQQQGARIACIVEQQGNIAGYGNLLPFSDYPHFRKNKIPEINDLWIYEKYRKRGLATSLIHHLERLAKEDGHATIGMGVGLYRDYGDAIRLYFQLGYKPDGQGVSYKNSAVIPGEKYRIDDELLLWLTKHLY